MMNLMIPLDVILIVQMKRSGITVLTLLIKSQFVFLIVEMDLSFLLKFVMTEIETIHKDVMLIVQTLLMDGHVQEDHPLVLIVAQLLVEMAFELDLKDVMMALMILKVAILIAQMKLLVMTVLILLDNPLYALLNVEMAL